MGQTRHEATMSVGRHPETKRGMVGNTIPCCWFRVEDDWSLTAVGTLKRGAH